jgi:hypothetical protein
VSGASSIPDPEKNPLEDFCRQTGNGNFLQESIVVPVLALSLVLIMINNIRVASPCSADWEQMQGDDRVRHCDACNLNVYNLAAFTNCSLVYVGPRVGFGALGSPDIICAIGAQYVGIGVKRRKENRVTTKRISEEARSGGRTIRSGLFTWRYFGFLASSHEGPTERANVIRFHFRLHYQTKTNHILPRNRESDFRLSPITTECRISFLQYVRRRFNEQHVRGFF